MANSSDGACPPYGLHARLDGPAVPVAFSWVDLDFEMRGPWAVARQLGAEAFGLIDASAMEDSPRLPLMWICRSPDRLEVSAAAEETGLPVGPDILLLIEQELCRFFTEEVEPRLWPSASPLAGVRRRPMETGRAGLSSRRRRA